MKHRDDDIADRWLQLMDIALKGVKGGDREMALLALEEAVRDTDEILRRNRESAEGLPSGEKPAAVSRPKSSISKREGNDG